MRSWRGSCSRNWIWRTHCKNMALMSSLGTQSCPGIAFSSIPCRSQMTTWRTYIFQSRSVCSAKASPSIFDGIYRKFADRKQGSASIMAGNTLNQRSPENSLLITLLGFSSMEIISRHCDQMLFFYTCRSAVDDLRASLFAYERPAEDMGYRGRGRRGRGRGRGRY